jgi:DNA-binding CsgD family transcriptional regulator
VCAGYGRTVLLSGEAGIGKTALVEEFLREARRAAPLVLSGACYDVTVTPAYGPWNEAFEDGQAQELQVADQALWSDAERLNSFQVQHAFFREIRNRLISDASDKPIIIVLEDLHWSDQESLDLLRFLSRSIDQASVLLVATYRDDEHLAQGALAQVLPNLVREAQPTRIELQRFDADVIGNLLDQRYGLPPVDRHRLAAGLHRRTEGNPFFVAELLRALVVGGALTRTDAGWVLGALNEVGVPALLRQVIDRRFQRLDEESKTALQIAAVLGYEIRPELWGSVIDLDETSLARVVQVALDEGLLEELPESSQLRFRHALVRETLYASLALPWRRIRHREIAEKIAVRHDADPATVASHYALAGDARAAAWQLEAARQARRHYAPNSIIRHLDAALTPENALSGRERMDAHQLRGWAFEVSGNFGAAHDNYQQELLLARESSHPEAEWGALMRLAELWAGRDYDRSEAYIHQALEIARKTGEQALIGHSLNRLGNWHMNQEDPALARKYHDQALTIFQAVEDQPGIAATYDLLGMTCVLGGTLVDGTRHYERAIDLFQMLDNRQGLSSSHANVTHDGTSYMTESMAPNYMSLNECIEMAERAHAIATEIDYRAGEVFALMRLLACLGPRGKYQRAMEVLHRAIAGAEEIDHRQWLSATNSVAGWLYLDLLDPESAISYIMRARSIAEEIGSSHWIRCNSGLLASAYLANGELDAADAELQHVWWERMPARTMAQRQVWCARIEQELHGGNPDLALRLTDTVIDDLPNFSTERPPVRLTMLRARALIESGQLDEANSLLQTARSICEAKGARSWLWRIYRLLGVMHQSGGRRPIAAGNYSEARRIIDEIASTIDDPSYRQRFQSLAFAEIPVSWTPTRLQVTKGLYGGLTRRQRDVASLIAMGCSNREIADNLSISERTVESHVTSILSTLGVDSRAQVAAWALNHGLVSGSSPESDY